MDKKDKLLFGFIAFEFALMFLCIILAFGFKIEFSPTGHIILGVGVLGLIAFIVLLFKK